MSCLPTDLTTYVVLMARIQRAMTQSDLVNLIMPLIAFEQGRFVHDFANRWLQRWMELDLGPVPQKLWPPT